MTVINVGYDASGNGNNWTTNNIDQNTSGTGADVLVDVPTLWGTDTGTGGEVRGNYATWNPLDNNRGGGGVTYTNGNLTLTGSTQGGARSTISLSSGKWYSELTCSSGSRWQFGIANSVFNLYNDNTGKWVYYDSTGFISDTGVTKQSSLSTCTTGDVIGIAFDVDAGTIAFYKNGTQLGTTYSYTAFTFVFVAAYMVSSSVGDFNAGQRPFANTAPSGFKSLCTTNLPEPTIVEGGDYMDVSLWTGNGSSQSITGLAYQPDLVWVKSRNDTWNHTWTDAVRGNTKYLFSSTTDAEVTSTDRVTAFNSDGFSLGSNGSVNANTTTYVAWNWKANGSGVSNTDGSITSTVSANTTSGVSIVTYTGTGSNATVGHGLGSAPKMVIVKTRSNADNWAVWSVGLTSASYHLRLNGTNAQIADIGGGTTVWNGTAPTSTVFSIGSGYNETNGSGYTYVAYCFSPVEGFSAFNVYTGNGSADGPFIFLNFRPRYVMWKGSSFSSNWRIADSARNTYNVASANLEANLSDAEGSTSNTVDFLSNGFKIRGTGGDTNTSSGTIIYAAFAENPFKYALAR